MQTFKQYLNEVEKKPTKKKVADDSSSKMKLFNPERFRSSVEKVLDALVKSSAAEEAGFGDLNDLILLEALTVAKEVLVKRLRPFIENPEYQEYKGDTTDAKLIKNIRDQIKETLHLHFPSMKRVMNIFLTLVVDPILDEIKRVSPGKAAKSLDATRFDASAMDAFGQLMRFVINSLVVPHADDAKVAAHVLAKWNSQVRHRNAEKTVSKQQRLETIRAAAEAAQAKRAEETE